MRNAGRQLANRFKLLSLGELALQHAPVRDILAENENPQAVSRSALDGADREPHKAVGLVGSGEVDIIEFDGPLQFSAAPDPFEHSGCVPWQGAVGQGVAEHVGTR